MPNLTLREFVDSINRCVDEIGGDLETTIGSHNCGATFSIIYDDGGEDDTYFGVESVDLYYRFGCMCPDGIKIKLKLEQT